MDRPDRPGHCSRRKEVARELVTRPPEHAQTRQTRSLFQKKRSGERAGYSATRAWTDQTDQVIVPEEKKWRENWLLGHQSMDRPDRAGHCSSRKEVERELVTRPPEHGQIRQTRSLFQKKRSGERAGYSDTRAWTDLRDQVTVPEEKKWRESWLLGLQSMDRPDRPGHCSRRKEVARQLVTRPPEHGHTRQTMSLFKKKRSGERAGYSATRAWTDQTDQVTVPEEKKWRESWLLGHQSMDRQGRPGHCSRRKQVARELVTRPPEHGQTRLTRSLFQKK